MTKITERTELGQAKRDEIIRLRVEGVAIRRIAERCGVTPTTVQRTINTAMQTEYGGQDLNLIRHVEAQRLDKLEAVLWPQAMDGNADAADVLIRLQERRARLLGLDAQTQNGCNGQDSKE